MSGPRVVHDQRLTALLAAYRGGVSPFQNVNLDPLPPLAPAQTPQSRSRAIKSQSCEGTEKTGRDV